MKQFLHIGLSVLIYLSGVGVSVHQHFCKDELKNIAFWQSAESCHADDKLCPATGKVCLLHASDDEKKDCCDDRVSFEQADWDFVPSTGDVAPDLDFVSIIPQSLRFSLAENTAFLRSPQKYRPPPRFFLSLRLLFSSFLC
jgi:hypothetical protein